MRIIKLIIIGICVVCFPILLNYLLSFSITSVIGGSNSEVVWLGFWANYGGAILGGLISLYILNATINHNKKENRTDRNYNHDKFLFEQQKSELEKEIERFNLYLQIFDQNKLRFIYNYRISEKGGRKESLHMLGELYSFVLERFNQFSIFYTDKEFLSNPFLKQQGDNYVTLVYLLDDLQILLNLSPDHWSNCDLQQQEIRRIINEKNIPIHRLDNIFSKPNMVAHKVMDALLTEYSEITQVKVLSQIRAYINEKRDSINENFINKYEKNEDAELRCDRL